MVNIWSRDEDSLRAGRLVPILPVVFYHGTGEWTVALSVPEMIDAPEGLAEEMRRFGYVLHDLGRTQRVPLSFDPEVDFGLMALSLAFLRHLTPAELDRLTRGLPETGDFASLGWRYIIEVMNATPDALGAIAAQDETGSVGGAHGHRSTGLAGTGQGRRQG